MYIECNIKDIQKVVSFAEKVSSKNSTLPALETIIFTCKNNTCEVKSTNLSLGFCATIPASVKKEGTISIKAQIIASVILNLNDDGIVALEEGDGFLIISTKNTTAKFLTTPHEDFPAIPFGGDKSFSINKTDFIELLKTTFWSASQSDIKPEMACVYIYSNNNSLTAVATDGYRLAEKKTPFKDIKELNISFLIPVKNIPDIIKIVSEWENNLIVSYTKNQLTFSDLKNQYLLSTRLIDGVFPDYKQILPTNHTTKVTLLKDDVLKNIRLSNAFIDKFNHIKFNIDSINKNLSIYAGNNESGEIESLIEAKIEGEGLLINFNHRYFLDCFQSVNEQIITLNLTTPNKPLVIKGLNNQDFLYLIMPLNR
ncbi:DNA polymerase III subunit beta [Candidatus Nomurabacteria bacterium RIFCSPHIGHO2_02_FULL_38_15]|uniref:Beta sliding clamp n=1 Tax=Candidatus Nomurabacteria bacterium RIFCSPHIGHO2_02_FULL_38_15 TaxID=1801752 RepID=A0A1F6VS16_9BACT|nr:MAG: DNA polymerase III subunit beta [Candidatus Nomurabacteria bacterium RIFCSPHIGHO2_02_FULL_38_15]